MKVSKYPTCQHIMPAGRFCECPAKKGVGLCINHARDHQRLRNLAKAREVKSYSHPQRPAAEYRPLDELNAEIFESLSFPALEDTASIAITIGNAIRLLGSNHITYRAYEGIINGCRIAEINLRKGHAFVRTDMPAGLEDTAPVKPFGDASGFVLPEEKSAHAAHQFLVQDFGSERAHQMRTKLGFNDHMLEPLTQVADSTKTDSHQSA